MMISLVKMKVYYMYRIGDGAHSNNVYKFHDEDEIFARDAAPLKEGDGAFLYFKRGNDWRYVIVAKTVHSASPPYIIFQVSLEGSTTKAEQNHWGCRVRPLDKEHPCYNL